LTSLTKNVIIKVQKVRKVKSNLKKKVKQVRKKTLDKPFGKCYNKNIEKQKESRC